MIAAMASAPVARPPGSSTGPMPGKPGSLGTLTVAKVLIGQRKAARRSIDTIQNQPNRGTPQFESLRSA
jgi:hypothetical protein